MEKRTRSFIKRMKKFLICLFFLLFNNHSISAEFSLNKIATFDQPWGSSFITKDIIILTEKSGEEEE